MMRPLLLAARHFLIACLMMALVLAGAGRVVMAAQSQPDMNTVVIAGYVVQLCTTDSEAGKGTGNNHQQSCDQCPLCAPTLLPEPAIMVRPATIERLVQLALLPGREPHIAASRSPRQSQGPPVA